MSPEQLAALVNAHRESRVADIARAEADIALCDAMLLSLTPPNPEKCPNCGTARLRVGSEDSTLRICDVCTHVFTILPKE